MKVLALYRVSKSAKNESLYGHDLVKERPGFLHYIQQYPTIQKAQKAAAVDCAAS